MFTLTLTLKARGPDPDPEQTHTHQAGPDGGVLLLGFHFHDLPPEQSGPFLYKPGGISQNGWSPMSLKDQTAVGHIVLQGEDGP